MRFLNGYAAMIARNINESIELELARRAAKPWWVRRWWVK